MLRRLGPCLCFFPVFVNIETVRIYISIQSQAAKLDRGLVHCMISRHDHGLLLFHKPPLEASATMCARGRLERGSRITPNRGAADGCLSGRAQRGRNAGYASNVL